MDIVRSSTSIGTVQFRAEPLTGERTTEGFVIRLPITIGLRPTPAQGLIPMISGLRGTLLHREEHGKMIEIGQLRSDQLYTGAGAEHQFPAIMEWRGTAASLAAYERHRNGKPPEWHVQLAGEVHLLNVVPGEPLHLNTAPETFHGQETLRLPTEAWATLLHQLGILDLILLTIPLQPPIEEPMAPVWRALQAARDDFTAGGESGWRSCGVNIRQALTDWQNAHKPDLAKGLADRSTLTKDQRLDTLRHDLREFTHIAGHPDLRVAKTWNRDDALLALSTTCALLNSKKQ